MTLDTYSAARRLIRAATGDEYGDGMMVTGMADGYAEPGYTPTDALVVFGNWNDTTRYTPGYWLREWDTSALCWSRRYVDSVRVTVSDVPSRLARALERIGVSIEWCDEWQECYECHRAVRTEPDSYSWREYGQYTDDGYYCADCLRDDPDNALEPYLDSDARAITWADHDWLVAQGFTRHNGHNYESGWRPGQDDKPSVIMAAIHKGTPDVSVVFLLDENSQFYCGFSAYVRPNTDDTEGED